MYSIINLVELKNIVEKEIILDEIVDGEEKKTGADGTRVENGERLLKLERNTSNKSGTREHEQDAQPSRLVGVKQVDEYEYARDNRDGGRDAEQEESNVLDEESHEGEQATDRERDDEVLDDGELFLLGQYEVDDAGAEREPNQKRRELEEPITNERVEQAETHGDESVAEFLHCVLVAAAQTRRRNRGRRRRRGLMIVWMMVVLLLQLLSDLAQVDLRQMHEAGRQMREEQVVVALVVP